MTDDGATSAHHAAKTAYLNLGLDTAAVTSGISKALLDAWSPSTNSLIGPMFADSTKGIGSMIAQSFDTSGISKLIAGMVQSPSISKQLVDSYASFGQLAQPGLSQIYPALQMAGFFSGGTELQKSVAAVSGFLAQSIDTRSFAQSLLSQATSLRSELVDQDFDDITADFLEQQPEVAAAIQDQPFLIDLSPAERKLIVWFIGTIVAIYVTMGVVNISLDSEEFGQLLSGLGIAGPASGVAAGKVTSKLLDKLPKASAE
ncbi:hypothetical protein [Pseudarthrobacter sp. ATCC 49987]|uniref:hypothetical protein n=1 Tax=Pseudarthrobacter sp. ATCC 49987 TaxID=2698204 RepID=UPI0013699066|nr:hypothetical protein [Pseudarthrobacter sp. ATCC 49987]